ncbi:MerR family transcriptional regulator [Streptomyces sp. DSM 41014]|uniref:MerR family transcriptional regulator n=1 Tax=Streptomyces hintoniae TaxID=3075521 RepID=A0ABU2UWJ0_9ACTN|nr:MerR family transcriptional regulator [Streptomyces sp. DSM 41014]MDT0477384.1 MerR family transcriptional regulator [Streptomyces sp. DSM 41014]
MALTPDADPGREAADGTLWFTIRAAATFTGRDPQTIYSWERRGHLDRTSAARDEHGRRIYTQQQIAAAERAARLNTNRVRRITSG